MCKYEIWYNMIIRNACNRGWTRDSAPCYVERHHIVPRSLGGSDHCNNLVFLTAKEHYVVHRLLCRYGDANQKQRMVFAMQRFIYSMKDRTHIKSHVYEQIKQGISKAKKTQMLNNKHRLGVPHSVEIKKKMSEQRKNIPKSESTKQKMSISAKAAKILWLPQACPHCGVESTNKSNMTRWHFSNCKARHGA